ncbi:MAG: lysylphosphatidylglycerol synthase transmembrane domain-containing protein [Sphingobium sp.]
MHQGIDAGDPSRITGVSRWLRLTLQYAMGLVLLALFFRQVDASQLGAHVARLDTSILLIALLAYCADFLLRAVRFWLLLMATGGRAVPWKAVPGPFIASFGFSDILPFRAGDLFRLFWFQRQLRLPGGRVLGAMVIERCLDLASLLLLGVLTVVTFLPVRQAGLVIGLVLLGGVVLHLALRAIPFSERDLGQPSPRPGWRGRIIDPVMDALGSFRILRSWHLSLGLVALSLLCWILESCVLIGAWIGLGGDAGDWVKPLAGFVASTLATLVPSLPGHFGTFELLGMEMFHYLDVTPDFAAAVLLVGHMLLWAPTALFAAVWFVTARPDRGSGQAAEQAESLLPQGRAMR